MKESWEDLSQELSETEVLLGDVKERIRLVMEAAQTKAALEDEYNELTRSADRSTIKRQLTHIADRLAEVEATLESRLLSWGSLKEPFWQMVRFTGLGILLGALLQRCAGC